MYTEERLFLAEHRRVINKSSNHQSSFQSLHSNIHIFLIHKKQHNIECSSHCAPGSQLQSGATGEEPIKECIICGNTDNQKSRYATWGKTERMYLEKHLGMSPQDSTFICKKHLVEARRHGHKYDHVPSWKTSPSSAQEFSK